MKKWFSKLATSVLALTLMAGMATKTQAQGRIFSASVIGSPNQIIFGPGFVPVDGQTYHISARTEVLVLPFLAATGNLDLRWTVDGWGQGTSPVDDRTVKFQHNMRLVLGTSGFANPQGTTLTGQVITIPMQVSADLQHTGPFGDLLFQSWFPLQPAADFHGTVPVEPALTGGEFILTLHRQITVTPGVGPLPSGNVYVNQGFIDVTPIW